MFLKLSSSFKSFTLIKIAVTVLILLSFIYPVSNLDISDFPDLNESFNLESSENNYKGIVEAQVKSTLENGGFTGCNVSSTVRVVGDEIYIDRISVSSPDDYDLQEVNDYISDNLGYLAEVYYIGE